MFAVPRREGQTGEDVHQDIFDIRRQGNMRRYPGVALPLPSMSIGHYLMIDQDSPEPIF
jgi:hypothetical protein